MRRTLGCGASPQTARRGAGSNGRFKQRSDSCESVAWRRRLRKSYRSDGEDGAKTGGKRQASAADGGETLFAPESRSPACGFGRPRALELPVHDHFMPLGRSQAGSAAFHRKSDIDDVDTPYGIAAFCRSRCAGNGSWCVAMHWRLKSLPEWFCGSLAMPAAAVTHPRCKRLKRSPASQGTR